MRSCFKFHVRAINKQEHRQTACFFQKNELKKENLFYNNQPTHNLNFKKPLRNATVVFVFLRHISVSLSFLGIKNDNKKEMINSVVNLLPTICFWY